MLRAAAPAVMALFLLPVMRSASHAQSDAIPALPLEQRSTNGIYMKLDGSYRSQDLPSVILGLGNVSELGSLEDLGIAQTFHDPRSTGEEIEGSIGYFLPSGAIPSVLGTAPRAELGFGYIGTSADQTAAVVPAGPFTGPTMLNGVPQSVAFACGIPGATCASTASLRDDYTSWHIHVQGASDFMLGAVTATPSIALIGGENDNDGTLTQDLMQFFAGAPVASANYNANFNIHSYDVGARLGLAGTVPVTPWLSLGAKGSLAVLYRDASLSGSDAFGSGVVTPNPAATAVSSSANTGAIVSKLEADVNVTPIAGVIFRGFAGASFDSAVAGIGSPSYAGPITGPTAVSPARIKFAGLSGWYVGGGAIIRF
jgi:hypothetical protein